MAGTCIHRISNREDGLAALAEMLLLCNEAARRSKHKPPPGTGGKPLALEYLADRIDTDDPIHGYIARTRDKVRHEKLQRTL